MNNDWIHEDVPEEEISVNEDGSVFIPIDIVLPLLDRYDPSWGTMDFKFSMISLAGKNYASGSLVLLFPEQKRRMVGAATVEILPDENGDINLNGLEATISSESIKNGSKRIGRRFGRYLNKVERNTYFDAKKKRPTREEMHPVKLKADKFILDQYDEAIAGNDEKRIKELEKTYIL